MVDLDASRRLIQEEETRYKAAVSEAVAQKLGNTLNFHAKRQYDVKEYFLNGEYDIIVDPQTGVDGLYVFPFDCEIINVAIYNLVNGTSGTTELDIKRATSSGGAFSSIFSVTPKITSAAGNNAYGLSYDIDDEDAGQSWNLRTPAAGITMGQLSSAPFNVSKGDAIRMDKISSQVGAQSAGLLIFHRPR